MKITDITLTFLKIGKGLLRVQTDAGVEGWAEAPGRNPDAQGGEYGYYSGRVFEAYLESIIKPVLIGEDPLQIERHWETLALGKDEKLFKLPSDVVGVIDVALWDLMGKETGLPVYALMGGAARRDIELYWSTGSGWMLQPEEMLNLVEKGWDMNFRSFKIRMDWKGWRQDADPEKDYQMFKLVREFLAEGNYLGFDANNGYSVSTAIQQGRRFEELGIDHFEEPIPNWDLPGLKQVVDALDVPISTGEQETSRWRFRDLIDQANPDILQPDIEYTGGLSETLKIYTNAEAAGIETITHMGGNTAWGQHFAMSMPESSLAEWFMHTNVGQPLGDRLLPGVSTPENGAVIPSDAPGFGLEIPEDWIVPWEHGNQVRVTYLSPKDSVR